MPSFNSLLPPWRDTLTETTTIRQDLIDSEGDKMAVEKTSVMKHILHHDHQNKDDAFDLVIRPSFGRAILAKSSALSSATSASEILATIQANKVNRMTTIFGLAMQFKAERAEQKAKLSAQRAEEKAKLSAQRAEQKAKLSAQRAAQFHAIMDHAARLRQQSRIPKAQRPASRAAFISILGPLAAAATGVGLVMWNHRKSASKRTEGSL